MKFVLMVMSKLVGTILVYPLIPTGATKGCGFQGTNW